jgi:large subunit ribosomal protein L10
MLTKEQKQQQSERLRAELDSRSAVFLLDNAGLSVNEVNDLRAQIRKVDASYKVYKNTVVKLAVSGTTMEPLAPYLVGPKALAYTSSDNVALAKVIRNFIKDHPALSFREAFLEGQILDRSSAENVADIPSKHELVARLLSLLQSPVRRLVVALAGPLQGLASVLDQIAQRQEAEGGSK